MIDVTKPPPFIGKVMCTVAGCDELKRPRYEAVIWCPECGEARCAKHRDVPTTRSCCASPEPFTSAASAHEVRPQGLPVGGHPGCAGGLCEEEES